MSIKSPRPEIRLPFNWSRRSILAAGLGLPWLASCSSDPNAESSDAVSMLRQSFDVMTGDDSITRKQAAAVPYASIGVRVGDSGQALLALAAQNHDVMLWTSSVRFALETENGRITRTAGLAHDMSQVAFSGRDPLSAPLNSMVSSCVYSIDLADQSIYQGQIRYTTDAPASETITILGAKLSVLHVVEHAVCALLDWQFDNEYWIDSKTGFVWQSRQTIHPELGVVEIVTLRPPG